MGKPLRISAAEAFLRVKVQVPDGAGNRIWFAAQELFPGDIFDRTDEEIARTVVRRIRALRAAVERARGNG